MTSPDEHDQRGIAIVDLSLMSITSLDNVENKPYQWQRQAAHNRVD
jgi:hypothetical protein